MAVLVFVMLDLLSRWKMVCCFDGAIIVRGTGMSTRVCFLRGADVCLDVNCAGRRVTYMRQNGAETGPYNGAYGEPEWGCRAESVLNQRVLWGADSQGVRAFTGKKQILTRATHNTHIREGHGGVKYEKSTCFKGWI